MSLALAAASVRAAVAGRPLSGAPGEPSADAREAALRGAPCAVGLFADAHAQAIPRNAGLVLTSGFGAPGCGAAHYVHDPAVDHAYVAANPRAAFVSADGRGFRLAQAEVTPWQFGAAADGRADDKAALVAALSHGRPIILPQGCDLATKGGVVLPSGARIEGRGGRIIFDALPTAYLFGLGSLADAKGNSDVSDISIEGVEFVSDTDRPFLHFFRVEHQGANLDNVRIKANRVRYTCRNPGRGDRWFIAGTDGGTRTAFEIVGNTLDGPMQLVASGGNGTHRGWTIARNRIRNFRSNAIALSSLGGGTFEDIAIVDNQIFGDTPASSIGVFIGLDNPAGDRAVNLRRIRIARNVIDLRQDSGWPSGVYVRGGVDTSAIGGFRSDMSGIEIAENTINVPRNAAIAMEIVPAQRGARAWFSGMVIRNNQVRAGDIYFGGMADGEFRGNIVRGRMRLSGDCKVVRSVGDTFWSWIPTASGGDVEWRGVGDVLLGDPSSASADYPFNAVAPKGKTITALLDGCTIDSRNANPARRRSAVRTHGPGTATVTVRNLSTRTAWADGLFTRGTGRIDDVTGR